MNQTMQNNGNKGYVPKFKPLENTDQDQTAVLVTYLGVEFMYNSAMGLMRYDGTMWQANENFAFLGIMEFMDMQITDAEIACEYNRRRLISLGIPEEWLDDNGRWKRMMADSSLRPLLEQYQEAKDYHKLALNYRSHIGKVNMKKELKSMVEQPLEVLDRDEFLLNTPEATWNLKLGMDGRQKHNPLDAITNVTLCDPGEEGKELWEEALHTFFCNDEDLIRYVQEIVGMAAIGKVYMEAMIIAYGGGRNGKSTFWNAIARVLGTYSGCMSSDMLSPYVRRNVKPEMAELKGKRLVIASELDSDTTLSAGMLKQLCSTDPITAEKKYKAPFSFTPTHTLVLYTNHLPSVRSNDEGTWRRLIVIPFQAVIPDSTDIRNYGDYLVEHAGPAILQWVMEGAQRIIEKEFKTQVPEAVRRVTEGYRNENDTVMEFVDRCCEAGEGLEAKSGALYNAYRDYCRTNGRFPVSGAEFSSSLQRLGYEKKRKTAGVVVMGLQLRAVYQQM